MEKNNKLPLIIFGIAASMFLGLIIGVFIGRVSEPNANSFYNHNQHTETLPAYTYPFRTNETGKINVNIATEEELVMIPGIGEETAKRIIEYRTKYGIFFSLDELTKVKGIGKSTVEKIRPYATVGG